MIDFAAPFHDGASPYSFVSFGPVGEDWLDDADFLLARAKRAREQSQLMHDEHTKRQMLDIAEAYEALAAIAVERQKWLTRLVASRH